MSEVPTVGLHKGVPFTTYYKWPAVNQSILKLFLRSPAHAREQLVHPSESTEAQDFGNVCHTAILEPESFDERYAVAPKVDRRTKAGKATWAEFEEKAEGRIVLAAEQADEARRMSRSVWDNETARELLSAPGVNEASLAWRDEPTGLLCKARPDRITKFAGWPTIADLKTCRDASPDGFSKACANYGYHIQAAFYLDGAAAVAPLERRFLFIAIEKERPYACAVYELAPGAIEQGRGQIRIALDRYKRAEETERWEGYPPGVNMIDLPVWARSLPEEEAA